jgi:prephenate dehydrogenase
VEGIALIGFGRFGAAFAQLANDAGVAVKAWDPTNTPPDKWRVESRDELLRDAENVVFSVPVHQLQPALEEWVGFLRPSALVLDVSSVKHGPNQSMEKVLGRRIPWIGTHPLFGPSSIALGQRPLRAVVCPNPLHPSATERARQLYLQLGCEVQVEESAVHDHSMAYSHALAFFVAKGMLDISELKELAFAPPSFQAMQDTIDAVRSDAAHLFLAIERANPYAAEARQKLLEALAQVNQDLEALDEEQVALGISGEDDVHTARLEIPDLGRQAPELRQTRDLIDELDADLVALLARRAVLANRAGQIKAQIGHGVRDPNREQRLLQARRELADQHNLDPDGISRVFEAVMRFSRDLQQRD